MSSQITLQTGTRALSGLVSEERKIWEIHSEHPRSALKYIDFFNTVNKHKE